MHILHKMNAHWRRDSLLHWRTWIEDKLNAFQRIIVLVSLHHNFFFIFFPVYIIFSTSFIKTFSSEWKKKLFCVKYLNVPKINCFLITEYNNDKNLFRKNSSNHDDFGYKKKKIDPTLFLWQIEPKSTQTTLKPIHPIHLQPHQNQLFTLMEPQNQNTGDL